MNSRYARQALFLGENTQQRIQQAKALLVGAGALGSASAEMLARAGIGQLTIVVDATDNFETSLIINDAAIKQGIPYIFGACVGSYGLTLPIIPGETPCLHCLLQYLPLDTMTCDTVGVISPIVQVIATFQVTHVMKWLAGKKVAPIVQSIDLWQEERADINVAKLKNPHCLTCGEKRTYPFLQFEYQMKTHVLCGRDAVQLRPGLAQDYSLEQLASNLSEQVTNLVCNPYLLSCQFEGYRIVFFANGRAIIHGVTDSKVACVVYNHFLQMAGAFK